MECLFCQIGAGKIPCHKVYEDAGTLAFLDIHPQVQGHTVIIPKQHGETVFDVSEEVLQNVMVATKKVMELIQKVLHPQGFNAGWNHGKAGGQAVGHLHLHVLPRYTGDGGGSMHSIVRNPGKMSVEEVATLFSKR